MSQALLTASPESEAAESEASASTAGFVDRRAPSGAATPVRERRQFANSHSGLSDDAAELAEAVDSYKAKHRRRFIDYEEMLSVIESLGYSR